MTPIVDASVCVKWFVEEDRSESARTLLGSSLGAPDLILAETFSALAKRARRGIVTGEAVTQVIALLRRAIRDLEPSGSLIDAAGRLAHTLDRSIYDCLYLALAAREGAVLVTADEGQFRAARQARIDARLL